MDEHLQYQRIMISIFNICVKNRMKFKSNNFRDLSLLIEQGQRIKEGNKPLQGTDQEAHPNEVPHLTRKEVAWPHSHELSQRRLAYLHHLSYKYSKIPQLH